jgi:hypothetical protein
LRETRSAHHADHDLNAINVLSGISHLNSTQIVFSIRFLLESHEMASISNNEIDFSSQHQAQRDVDNDVIMDVDAHDETSDSDDSDSDTEDDDEPVAQPKDQVASTNANDCRGCCWKASQEEE